MTEGLRTAHLDAVHVAAVKIQNAREDRDEAIQEAHRDGVSLRAIAEAAGVSHEQIRRIVSR